MIRLYVKIPEEFVRLIIQDRCWVVHIAFVRMVKFQFPMYHIAHPVVPIIIIFSLCILHTSFYSCFY